MYKVIIMVVLIAGCAVKPVDEDWQEACEQLESTLEKTKGTLKSAEERIPGDVVERIKGQIKSVEEIIQRDCR